MSMLLVFVICSLLSTYGGSVRKASTLRVPRHYERAMSSEPWMDFNETNRGWSSSVDPDDQKVCCCPSSTPSRTGLEIVARSSFPCALRY